MSKLIPIASHSLSLNSPKSYEKGEEDVVLQSSLDHEKGEHVDASGREIISDENDKKLQTLPQQASLQHARGAAEMNARAIRKIAVIGATGRLGAPVAAELAKIFEVRAIVRSPDKARKMLPTNVEIVQGDLRDVPGLRAALGGIDAIYLNLATETVDLSLPFYEEREGVRNLMTAAEGLDIQYIAKIGALGAYPPALKNIGDNMVPNIIRMEGHKIVAESGIPHTFFAPTHFMELLPNMIDNGALQWIGNTDVKIYWISVGRLCTTGGQSVSKSQENAGALSGSGTGGHLRQAGDGAVCPELRSYSQDSSSPSLGDQDDWSLQSENEIRRSSVCVFREPRGPVLCRKNLGRAGQTEDDSRDVFEGSPRKPGGSMMSATAFIPSAAGSI